MNIITTITASALIGIATFAPFPATADFAGVSRAPVQFKGTGSDCVAEAAAFTEVADLAYLYREDGEVFAGAIEELRDQLLDCLATSDDSAGRNAYPDGNNRLKLI